MFLKKICSLSNIPIQVIHKALCKYDKEINKIDNKFFNEVTISNIVSKFVLLTRVVYTNMSGPAVRNTDLNQSVV